MTDFHANKLFGDMVFSFSDMCNVCTHIINIGILFGELSLVLNDSLEMRKITSNLK